MIAEKQAKLARVAAKELARLSAARRAGALNDMAAHFILFYIRALMLLYSHVYQLINFNNVCVRSSAFILYSPAISCVTD